MVCFVGVIVYHFTRAILSHCYSSLQCPTGKTTHIYIGKRLVTKSRPLSRYFQGFIFTIPESDFSLSSHVFLISVFRNIVAIITKQNVVKTS